MELKNVQLSVKVKINQEGAMKTSTSCSVLRRIERRSQVMHYVEIMLIDTAIYLSIFTCMLLLYYAVI